MRRQGKQPGIIEGIWPPILLVLVGVPMALELIAPNSFYGVRTSGTLESLDVWYRANFFAGMAAVVCGGAAILINLAIIRSTTIREDQKWWLTLGTFLLAAGAAVGAGLLAG